jgi:serine/threonine protein kinase
MLPDPTAKSQIRIGRYRVVGRIGRGGMGMVYRGLDETLEREVALKTLTTEGTLDEESRRRFAIEAKAAAKLQHPNIVTVFELSQDRGVPYIAMELLSGTDLETLLRAREPLLLQEKLEIVIQICRGLSYAHEHGVVHRDIKPSNIRLLDDGTVKIMDFGIAKLGGQNLTKSGMMVGTVHYMSPEQVRGGTLDGRSDVFSAGVILYELLAGQRPFRGEGATEILFKIVHDEPAAIDVAQLGGIPLLHEIVSRALAKSPEGRPATAAALADELARIVRSHASATNPSLPADVVEVLHQSRRLLKDGKPEDSLARLKQISVDHTTSVEVRRALRGASREIERRKAPAEPASTVFPELEATFQVPPTQRSDPAVQPTELQPRMPQPMALPPTALPGGDEVEPPRPTAPASSKRLTAAALGGLALLGLAFFAGLALRRGGKAEAPAAPAGPADLRLSVRSLPTGAAVLVDGRESGVVTDGELILARPWPQQVTLTFRKRGLREVSRVVKLPLPAGEAVRVSLEGASATFAVVSEPSGASVIVDGKPVKGVTPTELALDGASEHRLTVSLDGYGSKDLVVSAGQSPTDLRVKLEASGPTGAVGVFSAYPVDVLWKGRVLSRGQAQAHITIPAGRQIVTLVAPTYFLRTDMAVTVPPGGETRVEAPGLGKLNVRASPDNCQVFVEGTFVDYPPILDRPVAAGPRVVTFKWPGGAKSEETVEVPRGGSAFVTGRKE